MYSGITAAMFAAYPKCPTKSYLIARGEQPPEMSMSETRRHISVVYKARANQHLPSTLTDVKIINFVQLAETPPNDTTVLVDCETTFYDHEHPTASARCLINNSDFSPLNAFPSFAQQSAPVSTTSVMGVWITNSSDFHRGITITGTDRNGNLTGCYWGWYHMQRERLLSTGQIPNAQRFVAEFGDIVNAALSGPTVTITNLKTQGVYSLTLNGDELSTTASQTKRRPSTCSDFQQKRTASQALNAAPLLGF